MEIVSVHIKAQFIWISIYICIRMSSGQFFFVRPFIL